MPENLSYTVIRSNRRTIAIQITPAGEVLVRCPKRMPAADIQKFVESKRNWISRHLVKPALPPLSEEEHALLIRQAKAFFPERVAYYAAILGVSYGRITVRSQRTRWGSCSGRGNLNFNCLLMLAPPPVRDYVVVHELCHRKEPNHSPRFWAEVAKVLPDYGQQRCWLKEHGTALIARLESKNKS